MKIKFISVEITDKKTKTGKDYIELEVAYKNQDFQDKIEAKKLNPFGNKIVFDTLKSAKSGDVFDVERVKNDAGYWDWVNIKSLGAGEAAQTSTAASGSKTTVAPKSTYETAEERAQRQIMIVRQSSSSTAVAALKTDKKSPTPQEVVAFAKELEAYVFGKDTVPIPLAELPPTESDEDDIPY